jgi:hypothetical protein
VTNHEDRGTDLAVGRSDEPEQVRPGIRRAVEADLIRTEFHLGMRFRERLARFGASAHKMHA